MFHAYFWNKANNLVAQTCESKDKEDGSFNHNCGDSCLVWNVTLQYFAETRKQY